jgi:hypothetical protein
MLRRIVGDATFFTILREYQATHRYGNADTGDFVAACERIAGRPLDWFFDPWLYGTNLPCYRFCATSQALAGGGTLVRVTVTQAQDSLSYPMPVDFAFRTAHGERRETVFIHHDPQTFAVILDEPLVDGGVVLDPDNWILGTVEESDLGPVPAPPARIAEVRSRSPSGPGPHELDVTLSAGEPTWLRVDVHDLQGRRVAVPFAGPAATGTLRVRWDGALDRGGRAPSSIYFARVSAGVEARTVCWIVLR